MAELWPVTWVPPLVSTVTVTVSTSTVMPSAICNKQRDEERLLKQLIPQQVLMLHCSDKQACTWTDENLDSQVDFFTKWPWLSSKNEDKST